MSYNITQNNSLNLNNPKGVYAPWGPNDAPIFIFMGQSNTYGHGSTMAVGDQVTTGYANVFTLDRTASSNALYQPAASLNSSMIAWTGLTTFGRHNLGTNNGGLGAQDHTYNAMNQFAKLWQNHITAGNTLGLPNLYVLQISWGGQGFSGGNNRWSPDRDVTNVESMYPRTMVILDLVMKNLRASGKNPRIIGVHWNQWEAEADTGNGTTTFNGLTYSVGAPPSLYNFERLIAGVNDVLGTKDVPWRFFYPLSTIYTTAAGTSRSTDAVRSAISTLVSEDNVNRALMDTRTAPHYTGVAPGFGIFNADNVHYNSTTQIWFAQQEWERILSGWKGVSVPEIKNRQLTYPSTSSGGSITSVFGRTGVVTATEGDYTLNLLGDVTIATPTNGQTLVYNGTAWVNQTSSGGTTIVNDLTTGGTTSALSAEQGKVLNNKMVKPLSWYANQFTSGAVANATSNQLGGTTWKNTPGYTYQIATVVEPLSGKKVFQPSATASNGGTNGGQILLIADATPTDGKYGYFEWDNVGNPCVTICLASKVRTATNTYNTLGYGYFALWISAAWSGMASFNSVGVTPSGTSHDTAVPFAMVWDLANMGANNSGIRAMVFGGTPTAGVYSGTPTITTSVVGQGKALVTGWPMTTLVKWRAGLLSANSGTLTIEWYDTTTSTWKVALQQRNMNSIMTLANNFDAGQLGLMWGMSSNANNNVTNMNVPLLASRMTNIVFKSDD